MRSMHEILDDIEERMEKGSKKFYRPLEDGNERRMLLKHYAQLFIPLDKARDLMNKEGTLISTGYNRVVIGDYGPYYEIRHDQLFTNNISNRWPGNPKRLVKYIWMKTNDRLRTKICLQVGTVKYADYVPGLYYVSVFDVENA